MVDEPAPEKLNYTKVPRAIDHETNTGDHPTTTTMEELLQENDLVKLKRSRCYGPMSKLMIFSLIVMIAGFTFATPFSLLLTIPAYMLANQADVFEQKTANMTSKKYRCFKYSSIVLNLVTIALGISLAALFTVIYTTKQSDMKTYLLHI